MPRFQVSYHLTPQSRKIYTLKVKYNLNLSHATFVSQKVQSVWYWTDEVGMAEDTMVRPGNGTAGQGVLQGGAAHGGAHNGMSQYTALQ